MQAVRGSVKLELEFHIPTLGVLVHQVICAYGSSSDFLGKDVRAEERKSDGIDDTALALPILAKDIVLTRHKIKLGLRERPEVIKP